ncbi:hypothetical protein [Pedobacter quisquiliarum]|uniref:hypothetical protein n=1 Tax=Pedobacter quisquiliarum TaxID=1834438 RepID=UPI00166ED0B8|nr:hypothetical protein [Pedobacter quisquiliarum]
MRHKKTGNKFRFSLKRSSYIGGSVFVLSGGVVVLVVSAVVCDVSIVVVDVVFVIVESVLVLSEDPDRFLVELHAEVANIIEPATARLKIIFFIE